MKTILKKLTAITSIVAMLLTGCSTGTSKDASTSQDKQTVTMLSWYNEQKLGPLKEGFEKAYPQYKLDIQYVPPVQQYIEKFMILFSSGEPTDLFFIAAENKEDVIKKELAEDISSMPIMNKIDKNVSKLWGDGDKVYGLALDAWVGGIYYNEDILSELGVQPPKNWDEFISISKKLKEKGIEPIVFDKEKIQELPQSLFTTDVIYNNRSAEYGINKGTSSFNELYLDSFKTWENDFVKTGLFSKTSLSLSDDQAINMFSTGKSAFYFGGPWSINTIKEKNANMKFTLMPLLGKTGNRIMTGAPNVGIAASKEGKNKEGAKAFLDYMSTDEAIKTYQEATGMILLVDGIDYKLDPILEPYKKMALSGDFYLSAMVWDNSAAISKVMLKGTQDIVAGSGTTEELVETLDAKMKELNQK